MKNISKAAFKQEIKDDLLIFIGLLSYALGWTGFLLPNKISTGGLTGVAALVFYGTGLPVAVTYFTANCGLLLLSIKLFGLKFSLKTIGCVLTLTFLLSFFQSMIQKPLVPGEPFMSCVLGGVMCGMGVGIVFSYKGSTGGTDIIALLINKYKEISIGRSLLICDLCIICSSYILFHSFEKIVYGLVVMGVMSYTVDLILNEARQSVQFFIFSKNYEKIADAINKVGHRGCTILDGQGWYSKESVKVIVVLAKKRESIVIFRIVKAIDPHAFISQASVTGVYGNGFEEIK